MWHIRKICLSTYIIEMITDLDEEVSVSVEAPSLSKAEQMAVSMLENGELDCMSQVCIE